MLTFKIIITIYTVVTLLCAIFCIKLLKLSDKVIFSEGLDSLVDQLKGFKYQIIFIPIFHIAVLLIFVVYYFCLSKVYNVMCSYGTKYGLINITKNSNDNLILTLAEGNMNTILEKLRQTNLSYAVYSDTKIEVSSITFLKE